MQKFSFTTQIMSSSKDYLQFILDQISDLSEISYRYMMWEYILYYHKKIIGWIYDNRLLLKQTEKVKNMFDNIEMQVPYQWAKPMIYINNVDNPDYLKNIIIITYEELIK